MNKKVVDLYKKEGHFESNIKDCINLLRKRVSANHKLVSDGTKSGYIALLCSFNGILLRVLSATQRLLVSHVLCLIVSTSE